MERKAGGTLFRVRATRRQEERFVSYAIKRLGHNKTAEVEADFTPDPNRACLFNQSEADMILEAIEKSGKFDSWSKEEYPVEPNAGGIPNDQ